MHYQILVPGQRPEPGLLTRLGLPDHEDGASTSIERAGPHGITGTLYTWTTPGDPDRRTGYRPKEQTILHALPAGSLDADRYLILIWDDSPPMPEDLLRREWFTSWPMDLGDGRQWRIPIAHRLPKDLVLDSGTGEPTREIQQQHRAFWDAACEWKRTLLDADPDSDTIRIPADWWQYLLSTLQLNYRLPAELASHLRLFNDNNKIQIAIATCDGLAIGEVEDDLAKKKSPPIPDTDSSEPGLQV